MELVTDERSRRSIAPIPLIFIGKNLAPFALLDEEQYASQIDLAPTLLALGGIAVPEEFMGRNFCSMHPCRMRWAILAAKRIITTKIFRLRTKWTSRSRTVTATRLPIILFMNMQTAI